jgi:diguanylate cyclase (GGDEF)-like protein/putative nucleotidyltransferase with HDIG domain
VKILLGSARNLSLRWKILLPIVFLSLVTWVATANILGHSSDQTIREQGQTEARQVATTAARHLQLRSDNLRDEVTLLAVEGQLMVGDRSIKQALRSFGPNLTEAFATMPSGTQAFRADLVKLVDTSGRVILQLRRKLLETTKVDDQRIITAARKGQAVGAIAMLSSQPVAYVVGAASIDLGDSETAVFLVGISLDRYMLDEIGLPDDDDVFVVGPGGIIADTGATADDPQWAEAVKDSTKGKTTVSGADYLMSSAPIADSLTPGLRVVAALPTAPLTAQAAAGREKAWLVLGAGLMAFVVMALLLSATLTRPLRAVTAAAQDLAAGDLEARAPVGSRDEIGTLASAFNAMGEELSSRAERLSLAFGDLKRLSETDALTGLFNHRAVYAAFDREMARARRHGLVFSVAVVDIDNFKLINDTYGHPAGDIVIRQVTTVLVTNTRAADVIGRHGGDEFMVILPETGAVEAAGVADKLRRAMYDYPMVTPDGLHIPIRLSFGTASFPANGSQVNELLACADSNLYQSKRRGGDMVTRGGKDEVRDRDAVGGFGMLDALVTTVDNKDCYTLHHSEDVTRLSLMMAEHLGLSEETQRVLRVAGLLHDVGKIGVPDALLRKPGRLTPAQYEIVKHHAALGATIIQGIPDEVDIRRAVVSHHERWDGKGFPAGVRGLAIPQLGRILAVADAFSAMTSDRPYRKALTRDEALAELEAGAGAQFDPDLVHVFVLAFDAGEDLPEPDEDEEAEEEGVGGAPVANSRA